MWKRSRYGCTGKVVKEQVCIRSGTRHGMSVSLGLIYVNKWKKGKQKIKDAAIAKVHACIALFHP